MNEQHERGHVEAHSTSSGKVLVYRDGHRRGVDAGDGRLVTERRPSGTMWSRRPTPRDLEDVRTTRVCSGWRRRAISVLSAVEHADYPTGEGAGPQWHVSIAAGLGEPELRRPTDKELRVALTAFGMLKAEEDNHHPGNARHFWLPIDPSKRADCECKVDEKTIVEADGYKWTTPVDGPCRGCELAALELGKACPIHGELDAAARTP